MALQKPSFSGKNRFLGAVVWVALFWVFLAAEARPRQILRPGYYLVLKSLVEHDELGVITRDFYDEVSILLWVLLGIL